MSDELPSEFDLIVVGTGFSESIVAAAASRIGKSVLHIDARDYYGGNWASFNTQSIRLLFGQKKETVKMNERSQVDCYTDKTVITIDNNETSNLQNIVFEENLIDPPSDSDTSACSESNEKQLKPKWTATRFNQEFRKFNIDLTPKLLFARGPLVELLISSNICRYSEFRAVDRVAMLTTENNIKPVLCSRSDVFTSKDVNVIEKRLLMKLLSECLQYEKSVDSVAEIEEYRGKSFREFLQHKKLTDNLINYVLYAIGMSTDETECIEGVLRTKKFLTSLGRFGNTPFLFPMYGCGEIPQCFCRLCAVFGGLYCLKRPVSEIRFKTGSFESIICNGQTIKASNIILGHDELYEGLINLINNDIATESSHEELSSCGNISRGIFIIDEPLGDAELNIGGGGVVFLKIPGWNNGAYVIQLAYYSGTCPQGLYLIHITTARESEAKLDLEPFVKRLFKIGSDDQTDNKPNILWKLYFNIPKCLKCEHGLNDNQLPIGIHIACGPFFELDYDQSIDNAKNIFHKIYPNEEFLPRAPDPEEIIIGDEDDCNDPDDVIEKLTEVVGGIDNEEKCIEENNLNETIDAPKI